MFTIETAIQTLTDAQSANDRDAVRAAAQYLIQHKSELPGTGRVIFQLADAELADPNWEKVREGSYCPCECGQPDCENRYVRVIGAAVRHEIKADEGREVVVTAGNRVYLARKGETQPTWTFFIDPTERPNRIIEIRAISSRPIVLPLEVAKAQLSGASDVQRTLRGAAPDGLPEVVARVESVSDEAIVLFVDNGWDIVTIRDQVEEGTRVTVGAEKVYLRRKGGDEMSAVVAYSVEEGAFIMETDPLNPMNALQALLGGGGPPAIPLTQIGQLLSTMSDADRTFAAPGTFSPMVRLESVSVLGSTVDLVVDKEFETYTPPAQPKVMILPAGAGLGQLLAGLGGGDGGPDDLDLAEDLD